MAKLCRTPRRRRRLVRLLASSDQRTRRQQDPKEDAERHVWVDVLLHSCLPRSAWESYSLALIIQHVGDRAMMNRAYMLALSAESNRHPRAPWLVAAIRDRQLILRGLPQYYGTQFRTLPSGRLELLPLDGCCTDQEREARGLPAVAELEAFLRSQ